MRTVETVKDAVRPKAPTNGAQVSSMTLGSAAALLAIYLAANVIPGLSEHLPDLDPQAAIGVLMAALVGLFGKDPRR